MMFINDKETEKARKSIFKSISDSDIFIDIQREKGNCLVYAKIPSYIENCISKRNKTLTTIKLFLDAGETANDKPHIVYIGNFLDNRIDNINSPFFIINGDKPTFNIGLLRIKDISKGLVFEIKGTIPLIAEKTISTMMENFKVYVISLIKNLKAEISLSGEIKSK